MTLPYGFPYGPYKILTPFCKDKMQASCSLWGCLTEITVLFSINPLL